MIQIGRVTVGLLAGPAAIRRWLAAAPRGLAAGRQRLAGGAGLGWARVGGVDLAVPVAIGLVILASLDQLGRSIAGLPFGLVWLGLTAVAVVGLRIRPFGRRAGLLGSTLVVGVVVLWLLFDILLWGQSNHLYDLNVYLGSAARWLDGGQPYMTAASSNWPSGPRDNFFLYPPPLLPFFGVLSRLPEAPVAVGWTLAMAACAYKAYRFLGLSRISSLALLAFPPVMIGLESGNVASLTFLLFAASVRAGGTLVVDGLFKVQTGLPALWLVRQRRGRAILAGAAIVAAVVVVTLPLVGWNSWWAWWAGLGYRASSQTAVPSLFGYSFAKDVPSTVFVAMAAALLGVALLLRGRPGLAALGLASIFASPALWPHGFVFALPAMLMLENGTLVWLLLGAGAIGPNMWLLFYGGWVAVAAARRRPAGVLHPLAGTDGPWPNLLIPRQARQTGPAMGSIVPVGSGATVD